MSARDRMLAAVAAAVVLVGAGWFLVLAPKRNEAAQLGDQITAQRAELSQAQSDVAAGLAAKRDYPRDYATVARLGTAVTPDDGVASLLLQLQHAADASKIDFRSLETNGGSGATSPPPPVPSSDGSAPATQVATATLPPGATVGAAGFPTMPFSFEFNGDFFRLSDFLGRLEHFLVVRNRSVSVSGRFMTLDGISLSEGPDGFPQMTASVAATTYLLPSTQGLTDGATPSGPAPSPSSPTTGGTPTASTATATRSAP